MAAPVPVMVQLRQISRGVRTSCVSLLLIFVLALLPVLIPDGAGAFRIRDGGPASSEQTPPSCNPLFGQCTAQKVSGVYSAASFSPPIGLRKRFDGSIGSPSRMTKVQPLVEESNEVDNNEGRPLAGASNNAKQKSYQPASFKITDSVRPQLTIRTSSAIKSTTGSTGRSAIHHEAFLENSPEDNEDDNSEENVEDESEDEDIEESQSESEDDEDDVDTDGNNEVDVDDDDDDDDEDDDDNGNEDDAENNDKDESNGDDDDDEKMDVSDSNDEDIDNAESNERDEAEKNDGGTESNDDNDGYESDINEPRKIENERFMADSEDDESSDRSVSKIKSESKFIKQDISGHVKNAKVSHERDVSSIERHTGKIVEKVQIITKDKIVGEKKEDVIIDSDATKHDHITGEKNIVDRILSGSDKPIAREPSTEGENVQPLVIGNSEESTGDDDGNYESKVMDVSERKEEAPPPLKKLEKVRLADKFKSMEVHRSGSLEESFEKSKPRKSEKVASEVKKIEIPKPAPVIVQMSEVKLPPKPVEKITSPQTLQEPKKTGVKEKKEVGPQTKKETKPQPQKHSEKSKTKSLEVKPKKKSEKPKSTPKKHTEASVTLSELNDSLLQVPSFVPNFTAIQDPVCQQHGKIFLRQLRGYKLWALQMLDSSAKIPSGILRGNLNQLGDFDQCLGVKAHVKVDEKTVKVQGKYCLATIDLQATRHDMKIPVNLMQSRASLRASANEPAHFIPRFTTVNWAVCVPAACSAYDVQSVMEDALSSYNVSTGLRFTVGVDPNSCFVKQKAQPYSKETVAVLYFYAMTLCLVFVATLRDYCVTSDGTGRYSERIIMAFSLRRTTTALLLDSQSDEDIRCIHGVRTLATIFLYVIHKLLLVSWFPFANRISLTEAVNNPLSSILRVSIVHTDSLLLISGILTAYHMAKEFDKRGEIRWFCRFVAKLIRSTPALLAVVFWYAFIMEHTGTGPQWNNVIKSNAELCKKNAWTNLLYIQNFFPVEEMCATHTHHLALDMQLYLLAPMLVFFLYCKPIIGILVILFLLQVSATLRYIATANNYLSLVIFHGMTLKHLYRSANLLYVLPLHRATPYLFGVALGASMRYTGKQVKIHKVFVIAGWLAAAVLGSWSLFSQWRSARRDYTYKVEEATYFAVTLPVLWSASLSWIIFASFTNHGGLVNKFLSHHWMVILSRLSYSFYLIQFVVFFYNVGTTRYATEFQIHKFIDLYEAVTVIVMSIALTLLLDLPMHEVKTVIMECTDSELVIDTIRSDEKNDQVLTGAEDLTAEMLSERRKAFFDEEVESTGWDWQKDIVSSEKISTEYPDSEDPSEVWSYRREEGRRRSFGRLDSDDAQIPTWDWIKTPIRKVPRRSNEEDRDPRTERRSQSRQEISGTEFTEESKGSKRSSSQNIRDEDSYKRDGRSQSRMSESRRSTMRDPEEPFRDVKKKGDSFLRVGDSGRSATKEFDGVSREYIRRERSLAKEIDGTGASMWKSDEQPPWEYVRRERSASHSAKDSKMLVNKGLEGQSVAMRSSTGSLPRASELQKRVSSEIGVELIRKETPRIVKSPPLEEPRVSDEENWEYELRLRRQKVAQNLPSEEMGIASEEEDWSILKRRSSAEGKMALLNDTSEIKHFGAWSVSKVPNPTADSFSHGSSDSGEENAYSTGNNDYRETRPPFRESYGTHSEEENSWDPSAQQSYMSSRQSTSLDEEEGSSATGYLLRKGNKHTSLQNLSRISPEKLEPEEDLGWDFVKEDNTDSSSPHTTLTGLFKRASIIKSQASEEDPEYMLPERPKLVEQEQEHPFKKAWQMQKSRSEEDGPVGFLVKEKDATRRSGETEVQREDEVRRSRPSAGGQNEDLSYFGGDEAESTSLSYPASNSGDSASLDWIEEDERSVASGLEETELESVELAEKDIQFGTDRKEQKRHSEESNWEWNQEET